MSEIDFNAIARANKPTNHKFKNLTGKTFGQLLVIAFAGTAPTRWLCLCTCKSLAAVNAGSLLKGSTRSCGCNRGKAITARKTRHGHSFGNNRSAEYRAFHNAKNRCTNPNVDMYPHYGGRGIEFKFNSFEDFITEIGEKPTPQHSLDRIDVDSHYEKGNIRWATGKEQGRNTRKTSVLIIDGIAKSIPEWAESSHRSAINIHTRIRRDGWCGKCAVFSPNGIGCSHK